MTSRERVMLALDHRTPDRVPIDLGSTALTGMRPRVQQRLRDLLGVTGDPVPTVGGVDERLMEWAGADCRGVGNIMPLPNRWAERAAPGVHVNEYGVRSECVDGEWQITGNPLREATVADLQAFPWPEPRIGEALLERWQTEAQRLHRDGRYAVVAGHPVFGVLELGCWMCGYDDFMLKLAADPEFVRRFFDKVFELQMAVVEPYYRALGPYIDLTTSGDDFGVQRGPLLSPTMFTEFVAPYFRERIRRTKAIAGCRYWHHTCGSVAALLDAIIACGVDILNPVQVSAADMEPGSLKQRFGDRLVFWGGVDEQQVLPRATPDGVREHVRHLLATLGRGGGYVTAPAHEIQDDVPPENVAAWIETVRDTPPPAK